MKQICAAFLFGWMLFSISARAQDTTYYDARWMPTTNLAEAKYYRGPLMQEDSAWRLTDYFMEGRPQMVARLKSPNLIIQEGHFTYYDSLGNKTREGEKRKGMRSGNWTIYRKGNGVRYSEVHYARDVPNGRAAYFDSASQMVVAEGVATDDVKTGEWTYYYRASPKVRLKVPYDAGKEHGTIIQYYPSGTVKRELDFDHGKFLRAKQYAENGERERYVRMLESPRDDMRRAAERVSRMLEQRGLTTVAGDRSVAYRFYLTSAGELQWQDDRQDALALAVRDGMLGDLKWQPAKYEGEPVGAFVKAWLVFIETKSRLQLLVRPDVDVPLATDFIELE